MPGRPAGRPSWRVRIVHSSKVLPADSQAPDTKKVMPRVKGRPWQWVNENSCLGTTYCAASLGPFKVWVPQSWIWGCWLYIYIGQDEDGWDGWAQKLTALRKLHLAGSWDFYRGPKGGEKLPTLLWGGCDSRKCLFT